MQVYDPSFKPSSVGDIALMTNAMSGSQYETFADLRASVPPFSGLDDGELAQIAVDSGFEVVE